MSAFLDLTCGVSDILQANNNELADLIDTALHDMVSDSFSRYKNTSAKRGISIDLQIVRIDDMVNVSWKVTPKPAAYEKLPEKGGSVHNDQIALLPDADPETGEVIG